MTRREIPGGIAQLGEHLPCKQGVMSSNLIISTTVEKRKKNSTSYRKVEESIVP